MKLALATMDDIVIKCPKGVKQNMWHGQGIQFSRDRARRQKKGIRRSHQTQGRGGCKEDTFCETVGGGENLIVAQQVPQAACKI